MIKIQEHELGAIASSKNDKRQLSDWVRFQSTSKDRLAKFHIEVDGIYHTTKPIPYSVLEQGMKDIISNWNQKQKEIT